MFGWSSIKRWATRALAAATAAAALATPASGASLDEDYAVSILNVYNAFNSEDELPNVKDRLKGRGIRQGQFWFIPEAESGILLDSNVLATRGNPVDDLAAYLRTGAQVRSDFGRHEVAAEAAVKHVEFFDQTSDSHTEAYGKVQARIDIIRDLNAYLDVKGGTFIEERGDVVAATFARSPIEYQTVDVGGKLVKTFNRLKLSGGVRYSLFDYNDVTSFAGMRVDQDFRDFDRVEVGGRASYQIMLGEGASLAPGTSVFADFRYTSTNYDGPTATNRSSDGWRFLGGVEFELGRLLYGEAGMGYNYVDYNSALFGAQSSYSFILGLVWNPTPLMTFNLDAQQRFEDSTLPGVSGSDQTYFKLSLDYEVLRRLTLSPHIRMVYDNFNDSSIKGYTLGVGLRAEYEINRFFNVGTEYVFTDREFTGTALDYTRHQAGIFLRARF